MKTDAEDTLRLVEAEPPGADPDRDENQRLLDSLRSILPGPEEVGPDRAAAWAQLSQAVANRLRVARTQYGEHLPPLPPTQIVDEILCEVADICGWSVLLWHRLQTIRLRVSSLQESDLSSCTSLTQTLDSLGHPGGGLGGLGQRLSHSDVALRATQRTEGWY